VVALGAVAAEQAHAEDLGAREPSAAPRRQARRAAPPAPPPRARALPWPRVAAPLSSATACRLGVHYPARLSDRSHAPPVEPEHARAEVLDQRQRVADEDHRPPAGEQLLDPAQALVGESLVAHRQDLVDQQDLGSVWMAIAKPRRTHMPEE